MKTFQQQWNFNSGKNVLLLHRVSDVTNIKLGFDIWNDNERKPWRTETPKLSSESTPANKCMFIYPWKEIIRLRSIIRLWVYDLRISSSFAKSRHNREEIFSRKIRRTFKNRWFSEIRINDDSIMHFLCKQNWWFGSSSI